MLIIAHCTHRFNVQCSTFSTRWCVLSAREQFCEKLMWTDMTKMIITFCSEAVKSLSADSVERNFIIIISTSSRFFFCGSVTRFVVQWFFFFVASFCFCRFSCVVILFLFSFVFFTSLAALEWLFLNRQTILYGSVNEEWQWRKKTTTTTQNIIKIEDVYSSSVFPVLVGREWHILPNQVKRLIMKPIMI